MGGILFTIGSQVKTRGVGYRVDVVGLNEEGLF